MGVDQVSRHDHSTDADGGENIAPTSLSTDEATISSGKIANGSVWVSSISGQQTNSNVSTTSESYNNVLFHNGMVQLESVPIGATLKGFYTARFDLDAGETATSRPNISDGVANYALSELEIQSGVGGTTYGVSGWTELTTIGRGWGPGEFKSIEMKVSGGTGELRNATLITGVEF